MKRIYIPFAFLTAALLFAMGFAACSTSDNGPSGPSLSPPQDLVAVPVSNESIELSWVDEAPTGYGYRVQRNPGPDGDWGQIAELNGTPTSYDDTDLPEGTTYQYRLVSFNRTDESEASNVASATTLPNRPSDLNGERISGSEIALVWTDNSEKETGYEIQHRAGGGGDFVTIGEVVEANTTTLNDVDLTERTTYYYRVRAVMGEQASLWSETARATTTVYTPLAPSNLTAEATSPYEVLLNWNDLSFDELGFIIEMSDTGPDAGWELADSINIPNRRLQTIGGLTSETIYFFRVIAYNDSGNSAASNVAEITTPQGPPIPPGNFQAEAPDWEHVVLTWTDESADELGFIIEKKEAESPFWNHLDSLGTDVVTLDDADVHERRAYNYRIAAYNEAGRSQWSSMATVMVPDGPPNTPRNLRAEPRGPQEMFLIWDDMSFNEDGFLIERRLAGDERFNVIDDVTNPFYSDATGLDPETWYAYRVMAYRIDEDGVKESGYSNIDSAMTASLIILEDDFEAYPLGQPPEREEYEIDEVGSSTLRVTDDSNHGGAKGLKFVDRIADGESFCRINIRHQPISADGKVSFWIKLAPESAFGIIGAGRMNDGREDIITFQLQFNVDNTYFVRTGGSIVQAEGNFPVEEWFQVDINFTFDGHKYSIAFDGNVVADSLDLQNTNLINDNVLVLLCFSNTASEYVMADDLEIQYVIDEDGNMQTAPPPFRPGAGSALTTTDPRSLFMAR